MNSPMADELNSRPMTDSVTPRIPILGPYPAFMTSSPHFPSLLSKPRFVDLPSQAHEAMYICAYRFAAQLAGSDTATKQEKMAMLTWLRDLATEVYETLLASLHEVMPQTKVPEPDYFGYPREPRDSDDTAVIDLGEHRARTFHTVCLAQIARLQEITALEDIVRCGK